MYNNADMLDEIANKYALNDLYIGRDCPIDCDYNKYSCNSLKILLHIGIDVNHDNCVATTLLDFAAMENSVEKIQLLLGAGADINHHSFYDDTPFGSITYNDSPECIKCMELLLDAGSDINARNEYGASAMSYAAFNGANGVVKFLIKNGANVNDRNNMGDLLYPMLHAVDMLIV